MSTIITITIITLIIISILGPVIFLQIRRKRREQKNYERGLKTVPLLIHLPPPSDDIDVNGRDVRDVTDETISKAQTIYNIIASTIQKGFKREYYGQRHLAFEIVAAQGFVNFYAAVPISLVEVVKQAIISSYPTARVEEVAEHNIFSQVGRMTGVVGGELELKEHFAYPIATYQDIKRDPMVALLNSLSTLTKEDGAAIQFLMRPAGPEWRGSASDVANKKRKGGKGTSKTSNLVKNAAYVLARPPEPAKENDKQLSNIDQNLVNAIDEKTSHFGFEVLIRVVVSSNVNQRSQAVLSNIVASFSLYDVPGRNGFKYTASEDNNDLVSSYLMRFFPQHRKNDILNIMELATLFHFPDQRNTPTSQLNRQDSKQVDGPRNIPDNGLLLGYNVFRGAKKPIRLDLGDRQRHMYVVGQTGTGKSTFLENLALQDMLNGNGFAFVDPHGDVVEKLLAMVPKERTEDVIYFSPAEMEYPMGLNLFEFNSPEQKDFLIQEALNMLYKLYDPQHQGIMGPRYEHLFRNAALTIMADPAGGTFVDIPKLFRDPQFVKQKLQHVKDQNVIEFWQKEMPASSRSNDFGEVVSWFVSKFGAFLSNEMMRNIIGQTKSAFDLRDIMDNKKILLVNLSKGRTGELNSKLLGMVFVMKFQAAAMSRSNIPEDERVDFSLYVDEFQNFSTDSFATIMSEARKYRLNLIVANQFTTQLTPEIRDAVFGNMGTIVSFRIGQNDVESLGKYFQPIFDADDLLRVPNYNTVVRTLIGGVPTQPFSMATLPALGTANPRLSDALKQLSAAKYGRPKAVVEQDINQRMKTIEVPKPIPQTEAGQNRPSGPAPATPAPAQPSSASFLDDWLNKRRATPKAVPSPSVTSLDSGPQSTTAVYAPDYSSMQAKVPAPITPTVGVTPQNISSDTIDQSEVHRIAAELKQQLDTAMPAAPAPEPSKPVEVPAAPAPVPEAPAVDTIKIDRDGTFHQNDAK